MQNAKILFVEDQAETRMVAAAILNQWGYEVTTAEDGLEALDLITQSQPHVVIADWEMPGLDGIELCRKIRQLELDSYVYVILFTARDDTESIVRGMDTGADDYVTKPSTIHGYGELRARINAGERILNLERALQEKNKAEVFLREELEHTHQTQKAELESAGKMQRRLIPAPLKSADGFEMQCRYIPSAELSGDMLGYFPLDESLDGFYGIDVAGHGIATSILASSLSQFVAAELSRFKKEANSGHQGQGLLEGLISHLNAKYQIDEHHHQYFTMVLGTVDHQARAIEISVAGHPLPLLLDQEGSVRSLGRKGYPIGLLESVDFEAVRHEYTPGERLFLYSDGIVECQNPEGVEFGCERLAEHLARHRTCDLDVTLSSLESMLQAWRGIEGFEDDISIMAIEFGL